MFNKLGAVAYVLWGVLHLLASVQGFRMAADIEDALVQGRLFQNSWNLAFFSLVAIAVGALMNWRGNRTGYWVNLVTVSAADIGFIIFVLAPGLIPLFPGILGPVFWLLGALLTTLGRRNA